MPRLDLALLGPPQIRLDGHPVETDRRKAVALLAYLAVTGQAHSRDQLAELLWPGYERDSAYAYLRRTLWALNQMLGKGWLHADRDTIALPPTPELGLDTTAFQDLLRAGPGGVAAWTEAVALYRDDFLAGFGVADTAPFEVWQRQQAEFFRRELAGGLEKLVAAHSQNGDSEAALPLARRWLALDPLNENAHRALLRLLAGRGDRTGAIRHYEACVQILKDELGLPPQPETTALYEAIRRGEVHAVPADSGPPPPVEVRPLSRLPVMPTPFIGRRPEVEQVKTLVQDPAHRLITLTGPGGTGKTRLALQAAAEVEAAFPEGVFFTSLVPVQTAEAVLPAVAKALDFSFYREEETPRQQLLNYLREKRLMLMLDNFEHVLEASPLVTDILTQAAGVKLMVTSRVRLNVQGEQLYLVSGMRTADVSEASAWDDPETQAKSFSAVQLFLDRARRVRPGFALTKETVKPVMEICRLVRGMPLGLELAAAWLEVLPPEEIAAEITRSLDFLETTQVDVPDRQRSIRAVFESSWKLLSEAEREAFQRLCVFVGSFSREAAQAVSGASLRMLLGLANKSWLQPASGGRYQLHELLRQYGLERLRADDAAWREASARHARSVAAFVAEQSRRMSGPDQLAGLKALEEEFDGNVKAAWDWLVAEGDWERLIDDMILGLFQIGEVRDRMDELIAWFRAARVNVEAALAAGGAQTGGPLALAILGTLEVYAEESVQIKDANPIERLGALWRLVAKHDLAEAMGFWFVVLGGMVLARNIDPGAEAQLELAVARIRRKDEPWYLGLSLLLQSGMWGDFSYDEAKVLEAARIFKTLGVLHELGLVARLQARQAIQQKRPLAEIMQYFQVSQQMFERLGNLYPSAFNSILLEPVYVQQGQVEQLFELFHQDQRLLKQLGNARMLGASYQWESLHATRYSTFEHALAARQQSLELATKANVQSDIFWQLFELGDIYRIFGDLAQARVFYEQARPGFEKVNVILGLSFYERAYGDMALTEGRYAEALARYQAFLRYAEQDNHAWSKAQAHAKLALAQAYLDDRESARREMIIALAEMRAWGADDLQLLTLLAEPVCLVQEGRNEQAVELAAFLAHHPVSWNETKHQARALLAHAAQGLPDEIVQAAVERGKRFNLEAVTQQLLHAEQRQAA